MSCRALLGISWPIFDFLDLVSGREILVFFHLPLCWVTSQRLFYCSYGLLSVRAFQRALNDHLDRSEGLAPKNGALFIFFVNVGSADLMVHDGIIVQKKLHEFVDAQTVVFL